MLFTAALLVIAAVVAIGRRHEVRWVLLLTGTALALLAGSPLQALDAFARAMVATLVAPICASMGFAAVLTATGCDRALARVLLLPIERWPWLALPGTAAAAFLVNLAIPSQAGTAAALGPVALPVLRAARVRIEFAAAGLLLGASFGGDLLSPAAQDLLAIAGTAPLDVAATHSRLVPSLTLGIAAAIVMLVAIAHRAGPSAPPSTSDNATPLRRSDWLRAAIPLLPVALLLAAHAHAPGTAWLLELPADPSWQGWSGALPVVRAMLLGAAVAAVSAPRALQRGAAEFFGGMGHAYAGVISLTICAQVFGAGLAASGLGAAVLSASRGEASQPLLATLFPFSLSLLSGSGSGSVLASAQVLLAPEAAGPQLDRCGALGCIGAAFGRTLSPAAAVVIYVSGLAGVDPVALVRAAAPAVLTGAMVACAVVLAQG